MALVSCDECGHQVSSRANACPHCGAPVALDSLDQSVGAHVQTTQDTAKRLKLQTLLSVVLICISIFGAALTQEGNPGASGIWTLVGMLAFFWFLVTRARIWWHHK